MSDYLRKDFINSLPQPLFVRFCGDKQWWPVYDIGVDVPMIRIDVCGKLEIKSFGGAMELRDSNGNTYCSDVFYTDFAAPDEAKP